MKKFAGLTVIALLLSTSMATAQSSGGTGDGSAGIDSTNSGGTKAPVKLPGKGGG